MGEERLPSKCWEAMPTRWGPRKKNIPGTVALGKPIAELKELARERDGWSK